MEHIDPATNPAGFDVDVRFARMQPKGERKQSTVDLIDFSGRRTEITVSTWSDMPSLESVVPPNPTNEDRMDLPT